MGFLLQDLRYAFRSLLRPASGFQSVQFREIEFLSGGGNPRILEHMDEGPELEAARAGDWRAVVDAPDVQAISVAARR